MLTPASLKTQRRQDRKLTASALPSLRLCVSTNPIWKLGTGNRQLPLKAGCPHPARYGSAAWDHAAYKHAILSSCHPVRTQSHLPPPSHLRVFAFSREHSSVTGTKMGSHEAAGREKVRAGDRRRLSRRFLSKQGLTRSREIREEDRDVAVPNLCTSDATPTLVCGGGMEFSRPLRSRRKDPKTGR